MSCVICEMPIRPQQKIGRVMSGDNTPWNINLTLKNGNDDDRNIHIKPSECAEWHTECAVIDEIDFKEVKDCMQNPRNLTYSNFNL